jgi:16S rRNA (guanine1207-N2)-methyltransferase
VLAYKKGERIARFSEKKEYLPAWTETNGIAPGTWFELDLDVGGDKYLIHSMPGVFSSAHIDEGSQLLLNNITVPPYARVLDVGCGYGIIGMSAARKQDTCEVEMIDVDLLSVASCSKNIHLNGLSNATVTASDLLSACDDKPYQVILSNPPFHAGKETNYLISEAMIKQAYHNLVPGGEFTLVANRFLRYEKQMEKYFSKVFIKAQTSKFHVITGVR